MYALTGQIKRGRDFTRSEFVRRSIMNTTIVQRLTSELNAEIRKLSGMANNLNQIARKANALGYDHIRTEYLFLAGKIDRILDKIL